MEEKLALPKLRHAESAPRMQRMFTLPDRFGIKAPKCKRSNANRYLNLKVQPFGRHNSMNDLPPCRNLIFRAGDPGAKEAKLLRWPSKKNIVQQDSATKYLARAQWLIN